MQTEIYSGENSEFSEDIPIQEEDLSQNKDEEIFHEIEKKQRSIIHDNFTLNKENNKFHCNYCR